LKSNPVVGRNSVLINVSVSGKSCVTGTLSTGGFISMANSPDVSEYTPSRVGGLSEASSVTVTRCPYPRLAKVPDGKEGK
jgi:hypothetical protein